MPYNEFPQLPKESYVHLITFHNYNLLDKNTSYNFMHAPCQQSTYTAYTVYVFQQMVIEVFAFFTKYFNLSHEHMIGIY